jgi:hypothetical protein
VSFRDFPKSLHDIVAIIPDNTSNFVTVSSFRTISFSLFTNSTVILRYISVVKPC